MLTYRIFPYLGSAARGTPGSADYLHKPQGRGRVDNPSQYDVWYLAREASGAVGEVFGDLDTWDDTMFDFPHLPRSRRSLGLYGIPDGSPILNLDHALNLHERGMRPTAVVERNRAASQKWALRIFKEVNFSGDPLWCGVEWWSFHRPHWRVLALWGVIPDPVRVEQLDLTHPAVVDAANSLGRVI